VVVGVPAARHRRDDDGRRRRAMTGIGGRLALVFVWLGTFFGFVTFAHGTLETADAAITMHAARALWVRGDSGLLTAEQGGELLGERAGALHIRGKQAEGNRSLGKIGVNDRAYVWFPMGHVFLLVPFVAAGEALQARWPEAEERFRAVAAGGATDAELVTRETYLFGHPLLTQSLIAMVVPAAFAATSVVLLLLIARALGASLRDAAIAAGSILVGTQMFALGREQLSDGPGLACMLGVLLATVHAHRGSATARTLVVGGVAAGCAVLLRYQSAFLVAACAIAVAIAGWRHGRRRDVVWFALGGLPFLAILLGVDHARFGNPFDTGYPEVADWYDQPLWLGLTKMFFAAGRGVMWLSPLLWIALPLATSRRHAVAPRWLAWVLFATPFLLFAGARGWQGGQCWGVRYVTPGVVLLLALVLPVARPWERWRLAWVALLAVGAFANLTSVVAPTRGQIQLATQAARAEAAQAVPPRELTEAEEADRISWHPRFSPLHSNWSYAVQSQRQDGLGFERETFLTIDRSACTIEPLFGIAAATPAQALAPQRWDDRRGRHLWWHLWGDLFEIAAKWLVLPPFVLALVFSALGWRRYVGATTLVASDSSTPR